MCEVTHNDPGRHWQKDHGDDLFIEDRGINDLYSNTVFKNEIECYQKKLNEFRETDYYLDGHKWQFNPRNFAFICKSLLKMGFIKFKLEKIYNLRQDHFEFMVVLKK